MVSANRSGGACLTAPSGSARTGFGKRGGHREQRDRASWPEPRTDPPDDDPDGIEAAADADREQSENIPRCAVCGNRATCRGVYEPPMDRAPAFACDTCCGHGNEDGWCEPVHDCENSYGAPLGDLL